MSNVRSVRPPTIIPPLASASGRATRARWATTNREDPSERANRKRSHNGTDIKRYRDAYSSEDRPKRNDHPNAWNQRHAAEQRRVNRRNGNPGTYVPLTPNPDTAALAAKLGVEL